MAAAEGDAPMLRLLSECGVDTNIGNGLKLSTIDDRMFSFIQLSAFYSLGAGDYDNRYPIHLAAAEGEVVSVHFLTYAHADVSVKDRWG